MPSMPTIEDFKKRKGNSNFVGTVITESTIFTGTRANGSYWSKRYFTIQDCTDKIILTAWNDEIDKISLGKTYEFKSMSISEFLGQKQLGFGTHGSVIELCASPLHVKPTDKPQLPEITPNTKQHIIDDTILLIQIENQVRETIKETIGKSDPVPQLVGMYTRLIYRDIKDAIQVK